jgi:hypothetical protein
MSTILLRISSLRCPPFSWSFRVPVKVEDDRLVRREDAVELAVRRPAGVLRDGLHLNYQRVALPRFDARGLKTDQAREAG